MLRSSSEYFVAFFNSLRSYYEEPSTIPPPRNDSILANLYSIYYEIKRRIRFTVLPIIILRLLLHPPPSYAIQLSYPSLD